MKYTKLLSISFLLSLFAFGLTSCNTTSTDAKTGKGEIQLQMKTVTGSSAKMSSSGNLYSSHDSLLIEGSNGTLKIKDARFIVEKFELEPAESSEEEDSLDTESEEFESEPFFVDLPLASDTLVLGSNPIPEGTYEELEIEVNDLDFDEEGEESYPALADSIRSIYPDWPEDASMVITGSFNSTDGQEQPFKVFAEAEIEIEREFSTPLEITDDNLEDIISIRINPVSWFKKEDGTVYDLSRYDWEQTGKTLEFEAEFERGIEGLETDEEQNDDDDSDD